MLTRSRTNPSAVADEFSIEADPDRTGVEEDHRERRDSASVAGGQAGVDGEPQGNLSQEEEGVLRVFRSELAKSMDAVTRDLTQRFKGRISYLEKKVEIQEKPSFRHTANERHFDRCQRYLGFILEARSAVCERDWEAAINVLDVFADAIKSFQKDVTTADKYESGWTLVDRFRGNTSEEEVELRKLNEKILEVSFLLQWSLSFNHQNFIVLFDLFLRLLGENKLIFIFENIRQLSCY